MFFRRGILVLFFCVVFTILSCDAGIGKKFEFGFESYDFGDVPLRSKDSTQLTIENTSSSIYNLENFVINGENATDFTIIGGGTHMVMPKEIKQITIEFEPQDAGTRIAFLQIDSSAQKDPYTFDLVGYGKATPEYDINHTKFDCGKVYVTFSKSYDFEIANIGTGDLTISQFSFTGPNVSDFTITSGSVPITIHSNFTHPSNYTYKLTIEYAPLATGTSTATLEITHDAAGSPSTLDLSGTAEDPFSDLKVDPNPHTFSGVFVGNASAKDFEIESTGVLPLNISSIELIAGSSNEYSILSVINDGVIVTTAPYACQVAIGKKCIVTVEFAPLTDGSSKTTTLKITSDANSSPTDVPIDGATGFPVMINECYMGGNDHVELYNTGSSPVNIGGWRLQCFYLRGGTNTACGDYYFPSNAVIPANSCVTCPENSNAGDYPIGTNIMWIGGDGGEAILTDNNGNGVDYMFFNMSNPDHKPSNIIWNGSAIPDQGEVDHYRNSGTNSFSASDWSYRTSSSDYGSKNPGQ